MEPDKDADLESQKRKPDLSWVPITAVFTAVFIGIMYLLISWSNKAIEREDESWEKRLKRGYFLGEAYSKWGTDSLNYTDENGTVVRVWREVLYSGEKGTKSYWIALRFDGNSRSNRAITHDISESREGLEEIIKVKYSVKDTNTK